MLSFICDVRVFLSAFKSEMNFICGLLNGAVMQFEKRVNHSSHTFFKWRSEASFSFF